jgi:predicted ATPase
MGKHNGNGNGTPTLNGALGDIVRSHEVTRHHVSNTGREHGGPETDETPGETSAETPAASDAASDPTTTDLRIYIAGAHSTGKTTLARWIARAYGLPLVTEVARSVLAELEVPLPTLRIDLDRVRAFQAEVFRRQAEAERVAGSRFVSDRTFDNLAYAAHHTIGLRDISSNLEDYARRLRARGSLVFFVRPHRDLLAEDGVRASVEWDEVQKIDGMVKLLLELYDVDYITIDTLNMAERARTVRGVLNAFGIPAKGRS